MSSNTRPAPFVADLAPRAMTRPRFARHWRRIRAILACALAAGATTNALAQAPDQAQPPLPTTTLQAGMHLIRAEVADEPGTRAMGLMHRTALGPNQGMLFVFPEQAGHCFWMRNTRLPLTIAFIDDDGRIANLVDMKPFDESSHCPVRPVRFALEMEQGWYAKHGINAGAQLRSERFFKAPAPAR